MLRISVTNTNQRQRFRHREGPLHFGRAESEEGKSIVIQDEYVSRDQFQIEEIDDGKIRIENRGRQLVTLTSGTQLAQGKSSQTHLPARLTVGQTVVEIAHVVEDESEHEVEATLQPSKGDGDSGRSFATIKKIGKSYPFPLAYGFRLLSSITTPAELYKEQLRLAENVLSFIGSVALALLDDEQFQRMGEKFQDGVLSSWQGGISPGDWLTLSIHAVDQLQQAEDDPLARHLCGLQLNKGKKGLAKTVRELITAKNDYKHDRGPSIESEYRAASEGVGEMLMETYQELSFFADHPIRLVQDVNPRRRGQENDVVFLMCMGDHPGFATEQAVHAQNLRKGDLYIEQTAGKLVPLFPFMHATTCSQCKAREFFFVDRLDRDRSSGDFIATLKSFDRGHTERDGDVGKELKDIFGG